MAFFNIKTRLLSGFYLDLPMRTLPHHRKDEPFKSPDGILRFCLKNRILNCLNIHG